MEIAGFATGALFSAAEFLFARKAFGKTMNSAWTALYIAQLLILSLGLLVLMFLVSQAALLASAIGLVITFITLAIINCLKR